jgi:hypothetical protein
MILKKVVVLRFKTDHASMDDRVLPFDVHIAKLS